MTARTRVLHERVFAARHVRLGQTLDEPRILILQLLLVRLLDSGAVSGRPLDMDGPRDLPVELSDAVGGVLKRGVGEVDAERLDADVV